MSKTNRLLVIFNTLLATILVLAFVQFVPSVANAESTTIVACANKGTGALRVAYKSCTKAENNVTWGITSSQGTSVLRICKAKTTGIISLKATCTAKESKVSNNKQLIGKTGATGQNGLSGIVGTQGVAGAGGAQGANGINGAGGASGPSGSPGPSGSQGLSGSPGPSGSPGTSTNGRGITSIVLTAGTGAAGTTDTYTITYSDATTSTFNIANGANGPSGVAGEDCFEPLLDEKGEPILDKETNLPTVIKGIFVLVETALNSKIYVLKCDTKQ